MVVDERLAWLQDSTRGSTMVNLGDFLNEYAANPAVFWALGVGIVLSLAIFGHFYNRLMDALTSQEHMSLYVAIGVVVTIVAAALFSWKAALMMFILFMPPGAFMIAGEYRRTRRKAEERKKNPRRKRVPYAVNGRIDETRMSVGEAARLLGMALREKDATVRAVQLASASHELNNASVKLLEVKVIQQIEE